MIKKSLGYSDHIELKNKISNLKIKIMSGLRFWDPGPC
jgi:hypothetical protein